MERDLTSGSVWKNIVYFSLPYLLSYFLQTLYGLADLFIVGQFDSVASTTAVSIGSQVMHMLTVMIVGLAMGTTVNIGRAVGARDSQKASKVVGNTTVLFVGSGTAGHLSCLRRGFLSFIFCQICLPFGQLLLGVCQFRFLGRSIHTGGSGRRNGAVSYDLFYRNPVYHRV